MLSMISDTLDDALWNKSGTSREQVGFDELLKFCSEPKTRAEMMQFCGISGRKHFVDNYLKPLLDSGKLKMTIPDKPTSRLQKYYCDSTANNINK